MLNLIITLYSLMNGLDPKLSTAIAQHESRLNPLAKSPTRDGGLFQLNERSFKFHNEAWRYDYTINTAIATDYLRKLKKNCLHRLDNTFVLCYNMGQQGAKKIKLPKKHKYYKSVMRLFYD